MSNKREIAVPVESFAYIYRRGIGRAGRPPTFSSPQELERRVQGYFDSLLDEEDVPIKMPTISGLALALGFSSIKNMQKFARNKEYEYLIQRALLVCEHFYEVSLSTRQSPVGAIFALKNSGWKDNPTLSINASGPVTVVGQLAWDDD